MLLTVDADPVVALVLNPQVVVAVLSLLGGVLTFLGILVARNGHKTKKLAEAAAKTSLTTDEIRKAVVNSHSVNLRDDLDEKFDGLATLFKQLVVKVDEGFRASSAETMEVRKEVGGVRSETRELRKNLETERERIRDLEDTRPASPKPAITQTRRKSPVTRMPRTS